MPRYSLYSLLWIDRESEKEISDVLKYKCGVDEEHIQRRMHLTIYHSRRRLIDVKRSKSYEIIKADVKETRFMVLTPGGENPRKNINVNKSPIGIRLTRRNIAMPRLLQLRRSFYKYENERVLRNRRHKTSDKKNAFGSNHFQPHIILHLLAVPELFLVRSQRVNAISSEQRTRVFLWGTLHWPKDPET